MPEMSSSPTVPVLTTLPAPATYLCGLTWDGRLLWHSDQLAGRIFGLDPASGAVLREIRCPGVRADLTQADGQLYQVGERPKRLLVIDPDSGEVVGRKAVRPSNGRLCGVEAGPEGMWMCLRNPAVIQLRDLETMSVQREFGIEGGPSGLTYANGVLVYSEFEAGLLHGYDAHSGLPLGVVAVDGHPTGMTWDGTHVWYNEFRSRRLCAVRISGITG